MPSGRTNERSAGRKKNYLNFDKRKEPETLFCRGKFLSHAGLHLDWKIKCEFLHQFDWTTLAYIAVKRLPAFDSVLGIPTGGNQFASALRAHITPGAGRLLIADDVYTTGSSFMTYLDQFLPDIERGKCVGVVAFDRSGLPRPAWIHAIWQLSHAHTA